tara:strand:- start:434 stop:3310 length:2877 start_codon:yes stop_codon:yes gene_type:complete
MKYFYPVRLNLRIFSVFWLNLLFYFCIGVPSFADNYDPKVEILQRNLTILEYPSGPADGLWGKTTAKAYSSFLNDHDLSVPKNLKSFSLDKIFDVRVNKIRKELAKISHLNEKLNVRDASHLLRRTGFGAHPFEVSALVKMTRADGIAIILDGLKTKARLNKPDFVNKNIPPYFIRHAIDEVESEAEQHLYQLRNSWVNEMLATPTPQVEKLTLFWHNHFVSSFEGVDEKTHLLYLQQNTLREYGFSNFKLLVQRMLLDPGLLLYLSNNTNVKENPNENLARELLELFTLGEGTYSENTVKEAARSLTGHSFNKINFSPYFEKDDHDFGIKNIFSQKKNFDAFELVDVIFEQPSAATFLTSKFWKLYISELNPPNAELSSIANKFQESDFDLLVLISELLASKAFWEESNRGTIIKSPVDLLVGMVRTTGHITKASHLLSERLASLGQNLFEHPNVAGWPGAGSWISSTNLIGRQLEINSFLASFEQGSPLTKTKALVDDKLKKEKGQLVKIDDLKISDLVYTASVWGKTFSPSSEKGGMSIHLWSGKNQNSSLNFSFGGEITKKKVYFCVKSPQTVSSFYEDLAHFVDDGGRTMGFCYDSRYFNETEFFKILTSMSDEDVSKVNLLCKFLSSSERTEWFAGNSSQRNLKYKLLGNKKFVKFWKSSDTNNKVNNLGKKCSSVIGALRTNKENKATSNNENFNKPIHQNQLILDTVRFRWIDRKGQYGGRQGLSLGLYDVTFNNLKKIGLQFRINFERNAPRHRRVQLIMKKIECDGGCYLNKYPGHKNRFPALPNYDNDNYNDFVRLSDQDKKFVSAIWLALPDLIKHAENVANDNQKRKTLPRFDGWRENLFLELKKIGRQGPYKNYIPNFKMKILERSYPKNTMAMMSSMVAPKPPTLSENIVTKDLISYRKKLESLKMVGDQYLVDLLLPIEPTSKSSGVPDITGLFQDPVFQLN